MDAAVPRTETNTSGDVRLALSLVGFAAFALVCQREPIDSGKNDHADTLASCQRVAARLLQTILYTCILICFETFGAAGAFTLAYTFILFAAQAHSLPHGPMCRLATVVASALPVVLLWEIPLGLCVSIIVASLPSPLLWWPPKKTDEQIMEQLVEVEQWVKANLDELRSRGDDRLKLRTLNGGEERRLYNMMTWNKKRIDASTALTEQVAKMNRMVTEGTGVNPAEPSASARSSTDSAPNAEEARKKRTRAEPSSSSTVSAPSVQETRKKGRRTETTGTGDRLRPADASDSAYFEKQSGAWCGMHALNNLLGGPYVDKRSCETAAEQVTQRLGSADLIDQHLDRDTGYLSIDVINLLCSANLGIHVDESPTAWETFRQEHGARALINWSQYHWTVLEAWPRENPTHWRHTNSIERASNGLRHGRAHRTALSRN